MDSPARVRALEMLQRDVPLRVIEAATQITRRILRRWRAGDLSDKKPGRKPIPLEVREAILRRIAEGEHYHAIKAATGVSIGAISQIKTGRKPRKPIRKLRSGEQLLAVAVRCDQRHLTSVWPCRQCKLETTIDKFRAMQQRAAGIKRRRQSDG
jgi:hypothetical protein